MKQKTLNFKINFNDEMTFNSLKNDIMTVIDKYTKSRFTTTPQTVSSTDFSDPKYIGKHLQQFLEDGDISADDVNVMCVTAEIPYYLTNEIYEAALKGEFKRVGKKVAWCMDNLDGIHVQSIVYFVGNVNAILDS